MKKDVDQRISIIGVKLILSLSHHTMFYLNDKTVVVQTGDIEKMTLSRVNRD